VRRFALIAALLAALAPAGAGAAVRERTTMAQVLPYVMCVTCHIPLANAQSAQAEQERAYIQQLIDEGDTFAQIKKALVAEYGDAVLALPPAKGFDIAVYAVPIGVVAALGALLIVLLPRWRRRPPKGGAGEAVAQLSGADAARLEAELARFDR
jgi:cytochrome c-type biogenesis protein CcmH/NrfF